MTTVPCPQCHSTVLVVLFLLLPAIVLCPAVSVMPPKSLGQGHPDRDMDTSIETRISHEDVGDAVETADSQQWAEPGGRMALSDLGSPPTALKEARTEYFAAVLMFTDDLATHAAESSLVSWSTEPQHHKQTEKYCWIRTFPSPGSPYGEMLAATGTRLCSGPGTESVMTVVDVFETKIRCYPLATITIFLLRLHNSWRSVSHIYR
jgi:hypothetical protein